MKIWWSQHLHTRIFWNFSLSLHLPINCCFCQLIDTSPTHALTAHNAVFLGNTNKYDFYRQLDFSSQPWVAKKIMKTRAWKLRKSWFYHVLVIMSSFYRKRPIWGRAVNFWPKSQAEGKATELPVKKSVFTSNGIIMAYDPGIFRGLVSETSGHKCAGTVQTPQEASSN